MINWFFFILIIIAMFFFTDLVFFMMAMREAWVNSQFRNPPLNWMIG